MAERGFHVARLPGFATTAIIVFVALYLPIFTLVAYSFNASTSLAVWGGFSLDWYARALRERNHTYAPLILPHDAQARELGTGKSRVEMLEGLGFRSRIAPRLSVEDGIEAVRRLIPRMWIMNFARVTRYS